MPASAVTAMLNDRRVPTTSRRRHLTGRRQARCRRSAAPCGCAASSNAAERTWRWPARRRSRRPADRGRSRWCGPQRPAAPEVRDARQPEIASSHHRRHCARRQRKPVEQVALRQAARRHGNAPVRSPLSATPAAAAPSGRRTTSRPRRSAWHEPAERRRAPRRSRRTEPAW